MGKRRNAKVWVHMKRTMDDTLAGFVGLMLGDDKIIGQRQRKRKDIGLRLPSSDRVSIVYGGRAGGDSICKGLFHIHSASRWIM